MGPGEALFLLSNMWIVVTLLIVFILGLAVLHLFRTHKKRYSLTDSMKLEPPKGRIIRQKHWDDAENIHQPRRKRTFEEIKQDILRAQETED